MLDRFLETGFVIDKAELKKWDKLPTEKRKLDEQFRYLTDEELSVSGFNVVLSADINKR